VWIPSRLEAAIEQIRASLNAIQESLREHVTAIRGARDSDEQARDQERWSRIRRRVAEREIHKREKREQDSYTQKSYKQQVLLNMLTLLAVLVAAAYATVAAYQGFLMREQLTQMQGSSEQTDRLLCLYQKQLAEMTKQTVAAQTSADAAKSAAKTASGQLEASQRPWIAVSNPIVESPLIFNMDGTSQTSIHITAENISMNVATNASMRLTLGPGSGKEDVDLVEKLCSNAPVSEYDLHWSTGFTVFPKTSLAPEFSYTVSNRLFQSQQKTSMPPLNPYEYFLPRAIDGCVRYHSPVSDATYYTGFIYLNLPQIEVGRVRFDPTTKIATTEPPSPFTGENGRIAFPANWMHLIPSPDSGSVQIK
jgi:hypothetical protein